MGYSGDLRVLKPITSILLPSTLKLGETGTTQRAMQPSLFPYVEDRYLDSGIGSESGNDGSIARKIPRCSVSSGQTLYGQVDM